jgi:hypothetical protein
MIPFDILPFSLAGMIVALTNNTREQTVSSFLLEKAIQQIVDAGDNSRDPSEKVVSPPIVKSCLKIVLSANFCPSNEISQTHLNLNKVSMNSFTYRHR